jgi:hypothetical protein
MTNSTKAPSYDIGRILADAAPAHFWDLPVVDTFAHPPCTPVSPSFRARKA